jgi:type II secretory ATPase GspE/PulE/Tfp pilus assembly ATPase PilB-like protein
MSTLHTNSAPETITRLLDMDMDAFNLSDAILGILAQRLVRTLCIHCKEAYHPSRDEYNALARNYGNGFENLGIPYRRDLRLYRAAGCPRCHNTGYKGRTSIMEFLEATPEIKALILSNPNVEKLREQAVNDGMTTLMQDGIRKVFLGLTDISQVRRVCI